MVKKSSSLLEKYVVTWEGAEVEIRIERGKYSVPNYLALIPEISEASRQFLEILKSKIITEEGVRPGEILDPKQYFSLRKRIAKKAREYVEKYLKLRGNEARIVAARIIAEMTSIGDLDLFLEDPYIEEIAINTASEPVWVYHKKYGWCRTNVRILDEKRIQDLANAIGMKVGRQISVLFPLMDANLPTGDRVNATLYPISTRGNTITIRKFARKPWTITDFVKLNTISTEIAAVLWEAIQYELNIIIAGGTGSGKTSMLNALTAFIPPGERIISIEDTRELQLPDFLHWVPLCARAPNIEGKGEISMHALLVNSLRMRPDRIIVGEIRRREEAEVLFEAMHTGHSVLTTLHADRAIDVPRRLANPPISLPTEMLEVVHLILVQYRHRKLGIRRVLELAEVIPTAFGERSETVTVSVIYRWRPKQDDFSKIRDFQRFYEDVGLYTGLTRQEIEKEIGEKKEVLDWMVKRNVTDLNVFGRVISSYYENPEAVLEAARKNKKPEAII